MSASEQVHAPGLVFEDPVAEHALQQTLGVRRLVVALHADEREDAAADAADDALLDGHPASLTL